MQGFILKDTHLQEGMTDADFTACAGIPVATFRLSDFPHWELMRATGALSPSQMKERVDAIYTAARSSNAVTEAGQEFFTLDKAQSAARRTQAIVYSASTTYTIDPEKTRFHNLGEAAMWGGRPYTLFDTRADSFVPTQIDRKNASYIFRDPVDSAQNIFSLRTGIPAHKLANFFNDPYAAFFSDLHEMRHLVQLMPTIPNPAYSFLCEADADGTAYRVFRSLGLHKHVEFERDARHLGAIMSSSKKHWVAPMLDALDAEQTPPRPVEIQAAIRQIRANLFIAVKKLTGEILTPKTMATQNGLSSSVHLLPEQQMESLSSSFGDWVSEHYNRTPEVVLTALRQRTEGTGYASPLAQQIAERILQASDNINMALTHSDDTYRPSNGHPIFSKVSYINFQPTF